MEMLLIGLFFGFFIGILIAAVLSAGRDDDLVQHNIILDNEIQRLKDKLKEK